MPGKRKEAEAFIIHYIQEIDPSGNNAKLYKHKFKEMSDSDFDLFMDKLEKDEINLAVVCPNFSEVKLDVERNFSIAEKLGHNFFQHIWMPEKEGIPSYLTPIPYLVIRLPLRRQAQLLEKKISIPQDNNSVDDFTGQVTGASKGSKISYPEVQVIMAMGLEQSLTELMKYRGGDEGGFNAMNTVIQRTGEVSLKQIEHHATGVKSKQALDVLLTSMMLSNTL